MQGVAATRAALWRANEPSLPPRFRAGTDSRFDVADRRRMERELQTATREGRLALHYQPRLLLEGGRPTGAEALIRWPHRKRGLLLPQALLMPLAERSGQATGIGGWALAAACRDAAEWPEATSVSIDIAPSHLAAPELPRQIAAALAQSGLRAERLELGLSESSAMEVDGDAFLVLAALRDLGVGVAVDDFGAGTASLTMLRRFPLTMLRLDRTMIRDVADDRGAAALVRSAIDAAHALGLAVGAVGIENERQRAALADCGCDEGQGPVFGTPMERGRIAARLVG
jgi:EAL domain-containing protein (putative c-di-GMP-specific phosphodiesterase class I)